ncbi:MAG TPA: F0F1 ATP synthase subunit epsilon [Pyrinomonadaceae bacterium]|jgi:F-type H+-transporting ATPase subunit epsilon|nr:F0F1 ATP synthase subunit epsilon [Pyrinomonadaceae bacterium]
MKLEIVTPEKSVVSETVDAVTLPGRDGEMGILPGHAAIISNLKSGILSYTKGAATQKMVVSGGFVEVSNDRISVLTDTAETADEIDAAAARAEREQAERAMGSLSGDEVEAERDRFERAEARLQLAAGR